LLSYIKECNQKYPKKSKLVLLLPSEYKPHITSKWLVISWANWEFSH